MARASSAVLDTAIREDYADEADEIVLGCWLFWPQSEDHRSADRSEKVRAGLTSEEPWKFYNLGHGYCTLRLLRPVSAPNGLREMQLLHAKGLNGFGYSEGKSNLLRMRQEIPLNDAELAALDDGVSALESLLTRLADVPTPAGATPHQLRDTALVQIEAAD